MGGFPMKKRQAIIDGYLVATGANLFDPAAFIDWLSGQPDHEAYEWFFAKDDAAAAREYRIGMVRQWANGLRITANVSEAPTQSRPVAVTMREFPSLVSPVGGRKDGGGYQPFHPDDPAMVAELRRQGAQALRTWLARYRGVAEMGGLDLSPIEEIAAQMSGGVVAAA